MSKMTFFGRASMIAGTIKRSLAIVIPILFIGSFTVLLNGFPVQAYQDFLDSFLGGALRNIILTIQNATVGILAIYITIALNFSYMKQIETGQRLVVRFGSLLGCLTGFFILVGFFSGEPNFSLLSGQGVFSAMVAGLAGSALFYRFEKLFVRKKMLLVDGADSGFNAALQMILPFFCVTLCFAIANYLIMVCFHVQSVQHLFMKAMDMIFLKMQRSYSSGLLFTTLISGMWWFGIHGNNVLDQVAEEMFTAIIPGEIVSKSFIDTFVNMGGTGCTIGLLLAMLVFGKRSSTKKLFGMALVPGVFNIGELVVFGFPVIYNPMMAVPFILAPVLTYTNAYLLTMAGFVPPVTNEVVWTTPALMSGYLATGSARGLVVQLLNILISAACYAPFVIRSEKRSLQEFSSDEMKKLVDLCRNSEETGEEVVLIESEGIVGKFAKHLAVDLEVSLTRFSPDRKNDAAENPLSVDYLEQYDDQGNCTGAKAFPEWGHKRYGTVYQPLVLRIAKESGNLYELETNVLERAIRDSEDFRKQYGAEFQMSVKVSAPTLCDKRFVPFLQKAADEYRLKAGNICIELAEKPGSIEREEIQELTETIRVFGYTFYMI